MSEAGPRRSLTRGLTAAMLGVPPEAAPEGESLTRQNTSEGNRNRVQENIRISAMDQLANANMGLLALVVLVMLAGCITWLAIWIKGILVFLYGSEKPCDQPLRWWLGAMSVLPLFSCCPVSPRTAENPQPKSVYGLLAPWVILSGLIMLINSKTCSETAPELYGYAYFYFCFYFTMQVLICCGACCALSLIFMLSPGPPKARDGLIEDLETVAFTADMMTYDGGDTAPPECSVCMAAFGEGEEVKKTPCGHYFHKQCLGEWLGKYAKTCPLCRTDLEEALDAAQGAGA